MTALKLLGIVPAWHDDANCQETDPDIFFPEKGDHGSAAWAKRICDRCEVRTDCLEDALAKHEQHGIRGGLTPQERKPHRLRAAEQQAVAA